MAAIRPRVVPPPPPPPPVLVQPRPVVVPPPVIVTPPPTPVVAPQPAPTPIQATAPAAVDVATPTPAPTATLGFARRGGDTPDAIQPAGDSAASLRSNLLSTVFTAPPVQAGQALAALDQHNGSAQVTDGQVLQQRLQLQPTINTLIPTATPAALPAPVQTFGATPRGDALPLPPVLGAGPSPINPALDAAVNRSPAVGLLSPLGRLPGLIGSEPAPRPLAGPIATVDGQARDFALRGGADVPIQRVEPALANLQTVRGAVAGLPPAAQQAITAPYESTLRLAVGDETEAALSASPTPQGLYDYPAITRQGDAIAARFAGNPQAQADVDRAADAYLADRQTNNTVGFLELAREPQAGGRDFAAALGTLPPAVQQRVVTDPRVAGWIGQPLAVGNQPGATPAEAAQGANAFTGRLAAVTAGLAPEQARTITGSVLPSITQATRAPESGDAGAGQRIADLSRVTDALGPGPAAAALTERVAQDVAAMRPDDFADVVSTTMAEASPALLIKSLDVRAQRGENVRADAALVAEGVRGLIAQSRADATELGALLGGAHAAAASVQGLPGAERAEQALIAANPELAGQVGELQGRLQADGAKLLAATSALAAMSPQLRAATHVLTPGEPGYRAPFTGRGGVPGVRPPGGLDTLLAEVAGSAPARSALISAIATNPSSVTGAEGKALVDGFVAIKVGKEAINGAREIATAIIATDMTSALQRASTGLPADIRAAQALLGSYADPRYASALGMDPARYTQALEDLNDTVSLGGSRAAIKESISTSVARIQAQPPAAFAEGGWGKLFSGLNVVASVAMLGNSSGELSGGDTQDALSFVGDTYGALKDSGEAMSSIARYAGVGTQTLDRVTPLLGVFSVAADAYSAATAWQEGDTKEGWGHAMVAGGGTSLLAIGAAGAAFGPPGVIAAVVVGAVLIGVGEGTKSAAEQDQSLADLSRDSRAVVDAMPLTPAARDQLSRRFGDAGEFSAMPVINALLGDRTPQQRLDWINQMADSGRLAGIVDSAGRVAADHDDPTTNAVGDYDPSSELMAEAHRWVEPLMR